MIKTPRGYDINVDDFVEANIKKYPRFESVNAGYWLYGKPKKLLKDVFENRKTQLYYIFNVSNAISVLETQHKLNEDYAKEGVAKPDASFRKANYVVGLSQLKKDLKEYKNDYAKTFVFEQLLKLKIKQGEK